MKKTAGIILIFLSLLIVTAWADSGFTGQGSTIPFFSISTAGTFEEKVYSTLEMSSILYKDQVIGKYYGENIIVKPGMMYILGAATVGGDVTPLEVQSTVPENNEQNVFINQDLIINFSKSMYTGNFNDWFSISPQPQSIEASWENGDKTARIKHANFLTDQIYNVYIGTDAKDKQGNKLQEAYDISFKTIKDIAPPSPVKYFAAEGQISSVNLEWQMPDDEDLTGVMILRKPVSQSTYEPQTGNEYGVGESIGDNNVIYIGNGTGTVDAYLLNETRYYYKIYAFDASMNYSIGVLDWATPSTSPLKKPKINSIKLSPKGKASLGNGYSMPNKATYYLFAEDQNIPKKLLTTAEAWFYQGTTLEALGIKSAATSEMFAVATSETLDDGYYTLISRVYNQNGDASVYITTSLEVSSSTAIKDGVTPVVSPVPFMPLKGQILKIAYQLTRNADIGLYIYGISGGTMWSRKFPAGANGGRAGYNEIEWDGRDIYGKLIGNGIYPLKISADNKMIGKAYIVVYD